MTGSLFGSVSTRRLRVRLVFGLAVPRLRFCALACGPDFEGEGFSPESCCWTDAVGRVYRPGLVRARSFFRCVYGVSWVL